MKQTFLLLSTLVFIPLAHGQADRSSKQNNFFRIVCQKSGDHTPGALSSLVHPPRTVIVEQEFATDYTGSELLDIFPDVRRDARNIKFKAIFSDDQTISLRGMAEAEKNDSVRSILDDPRSLKDFDQQTGFGTLYGEGDFLSKSFYFTEEGKRGFILGISSRLDDEGTHHANIEVQQRQDYVRQFFTYECYPPKAVAVEGDSSSSFDESSYEGISSRN